MIEENLKIHDRYKFEIKFNYPIEKEKTKYEIDSYLFFPKTLGISELFNHNNFYDSIQSYIRFKTPTFLLKDITTEKGIIHILKRNFEILSRDFNKKNKRDFENSIKLYGAISKSSLREHVELIIKKTNNKDVEFLIDEYIIHSKNILNKYRELRYIIMVPSIKEKTFSIYKYGNEYLSLLFNRYSYKILEEIESDEKLNSKYRRKVLNLIKEESEYRVENKLKININEEGENSLFLYRASNLKKYISSLLYLNTRIEKADVVVTQIVYSIAAALSMVFATLVAFNAQKFYGNFTTPFFIALVVSYIFKDRIKDFVKLYFDKKLKKRFFNYKTIIKDGDKKIGMASEKAILMEYKYLSDEIKKLRMPKYFSLIQNGIKGEDIIFYEKKIKIFNAALNENLNGVKVDALNDIIRFDVSNYLKNMDNPTKKIYFYKDDDYSIIKAKRVYHINLIMVYKDSKKNKIYKKFKIILNRKGIINITNLDKKEKL
jgi:hypothetical protein